MDINLIIVAVYSYLLGSIPFGLILTKIFLKKDIRDIGSGNIGATNVLRTGNKIIGYLTLSLDVLKAVIPILYIKLKDLGSFCDGPTAGADIDAIGTIGGVLKVNIDANLLFDVDKYQLRDKALSTLDNFLIGLEKIPEAEVIIEGHTDAQASHSYNQKLGLNRAKSVKKYLLQHLKEKAKNYDFQVKSLGETQPVASNSTPSGRQKNRRVEIIVIPSEDFYKQP